jgi:hypothetical protein
MRHNSPVPRFCVIFLAQAQEGITLDTIPFC